ncbi:hypothetical protein H0N96_01940 [Candidatus Micrarchaeota archaeon]|nr:hypothetical protein [Candidatus Micrarchaeota archaeon]
MPKKLGVKLANLGVNFVVHKYSHQALKLNPDILLHSGEAGDAIEAIKVAFPGFTRPYTDKETLLSQSKTLETLMKKAQKLGFNVVRRDSEKILLAKDKYGMPKEVGRVGVKTYVLKPGEGKNTIFRWRKFVEGVRYGLLRKKE